MAYLLQNTILVAIISRYDAIVATMLTIPIPIMKNDIRNVLPLETLDALMFISLNAQDIKHLLEDIFKLWFEEKERKIVLVK